MQVSVGDTLPEFVREGTVDHWNRFAAANYEFAAHHWDDAVARDEGFPGAFAMAPLQQSFIYAMLRGWMGDQGRIEAVNIKLRSPFIRGRTLTTSGEVTGIIERDGSRSVEFNITQTDDQDTLVSEATAVVGLF